LKYYFKRAECLSIDVDFFLSSMIRFDLNFDLDKIGFVVDDDGHAGPRGVESFVLGLN
jgi:hypothetical protein